MQEEVVCVREKRRITKNGRGHKKGPNHLKKKSVEATPRSISSKKKKRKKRKIIFSFLSHSLCVCVDLLKVLIPASTLLLFSLF